MALWYVVSFGRLAEPVEVLKETEKTLIIVTEWNGKKLERRCFKQGGYEKYFRTKVEALLNVYERCENRLESAKADVIAAQKEFDEAAEAVRKESPQ